MSELYYESSFAHHGVKNQKWGIRRFQNKDGSLTRMGRMRYLNRDGTLNKRGKKFQEKQRIEQRRIANEAALIKEKQRTAEAEKKLNEDKARLVKTDSDTQKVKESITVRPKRLSEMSNDEIRSILARVELEKSYNAVFNPKKESRIMHYSKKIAETVGKNALTAVGTVVNKQLAEYMNNYINEVKKQQKQQKQATQ